MGSQKMIKISEQKLVFIILLKLVLNEMPRKPSVLRFVGSMR